MPRLVSFSAWPDRPRRCSARETPFGAEIITTRSMKPMSMPISRLVEQTTARSFPCFSRSSTSSRIWRSSDA